MALLNVALKWNLMRVAVGGSGRRGQDQPAAGAVRGHRGGRSRRPPGGDGAPAQRLEREDQGQNQGGSQGHDDRRRPQVARRHVRNAHSDLPLYQGEFSSDLTGFILVTAGDLRSRSRNQFSFIAVQTCYCFRNYSYAPF